MDPAAGARQGDREALARLRAALDCDHALRGAALAGPIAAVCEPARPTAAE